MHTTAAGITIGTLPYRLPLHRPWVAASATLTERVGALVSLTDADGRTGWGDCAPLPSSGKERCKEVLASLAAGALCLIGADATEHAATIPPEVRWAVETALFDLDAQRVGKPLRLTLSPDAPMAIEVNAALGVLDDRCLDRAEAALSQGYGIGKIKVGVASPISELKLLRSLCIATGERLRLRLDANRAWPWEEARYFLDAIRELPIDAVEEPLTSPDATTLALLQAKLPYAIALDESLPSLGIEAMIRNRAVRRLVIKPARIGGIRVTQAIAHQAAAAGVEVVLTSVVDSAIGVSAVAHLAAATSAAIAHGLGTGAWLAGDIAPQLPIVCGRMVLPTSPGLGIRPY